MNTAIAELARCIESVKATAAKMVTKKGVNEENTKNRLIVPILAALGWSVQDPDDVEHEYRADKRAKPVDFSLMINGSPVLFIEAKASDVGLEDSKVIRQLLNYANEAGVAWGVLTNGIEYHIFRTSDTMQPERRRLCKVSIKEDTPEHVAKWLMLVSKAELKERRINRVWEAQRVDATVKRVLESAFLIPEARSPIVKLLQSETIGDQTLDATDIVASLRRATIRVEFPPMPDTDEPADLITNRLPRASSAKASLSSPRGVLPVDGSRLTIIELIQSKRLTAKTGLIHKSRRGDLHAAIESDGRVTFEGKQWPTLSSAGAAARRSEAPGRWKSDNVPATNGWTYWHIRHPKTGALMTMDDFARQP